MALAFVVVSGHIVAETPDALLSIFRATGVATVIGRLVVLLLLRGNASEEGLEIRAARRLEIWFAVPYVLFAISFGAFSARAFLVATASSHMLVVGLLFGYGAGVATGIFQRPRVAVLSLVFATLPTVFFALRAPDPTYVITGVLTAVFAAGAVHSMVGLYQKTSTEITSHRTFATLARADSVTGLGNRLSLHEQFDRLTQRSQSVDVLAVFCLDLDKFKPVNDTYGHPVGDALLRAVSDRLMGLLREGDIAARVGGDEFVVVQTSMNNPGEADFLAHRMARAIAHPFSIEGHRIVIGVSVGYSVISNIGEELDVLIARADEALINVKRTGGGIASYRAQVPQLGLKMSA